MWVCSASKMVTPAQPRPLGQTLLAAAGVIGLTFAGAVVLYFATAGLLLLWSHLSPMLSAQL
jgi:hypothetical protein